MSRKDLHPATRLSLSVVALGFAVPALPVFAAPVDIDASGSGTAAASPPEYNFDNRLLLGSSLGVADIERYNKASVVDPGRYQVDIYLNSNFISRKAVEFRAAQDGEIYPCLSDAFLRDSGVLVSGIKSGGDPVNTAPAETPLPDRQSGMTAGAEQAGGTDTPGECLPLASRIEGASTAFDLSRLRLDISVPQALMKSTPRGSIDVKSLDAGQTMAYVNYDTNYYTSSALGYKANSFYAGLNAGVNFGLWRLHQQSAFSYSDAGNFHYSRWNNIRAYAERPLPQIGSDLVIGQNFTGGSLLSSVAYTGFHLETDERSLPDSMQGYAPVVTGIANTNARVVVSQNGNTIYQTTVAPGPFRITDLNPTSFQGDLTVQVFEANGQVSSFVVPFSAVPSSRRAGSSHYSFTVGKVRQVEGANAAFADLTYERGLTNNVTLNSAARLASDYQALLAGAVFATPIGAFGVNASWSNALDVTGHYTNGWLGSVTYSHTIAATQTTFALAGYRYSTSGYRDFVDALGARAAWESGRNWSSSTYQQRNQFTVNLNQNFNSYGSLSFSLGVSNYYGAKARDTQFQISYNNHFKSLSYNLTFVRQHTGPLYSTNGPDFYTGGGQTNVQTGMQYPTSNTFMATVTIPFGSGPRAASVSGGVTLASNSGSTYQTSVSGIADEAQTVSYGLTGTAQAGDGQRSISGNIQKNLSMITMGASYSQGNGFWQGGATARGSAVAHSGGVTLGPYLADTFGVVEAKGAEGATVRNGQGAQVDRWGYAIVPSLTPYRYNDVALDSKGIGTGAELTGNQLRVAPYPGSAVLLRFSTLTGHAVLIRSTLPDGKPLPLGADVLNSDGAAIGMVGQGGQVYARVPSERGVVTVKWGGRHEDQCTIPYDVSGQDPKAALVNLTAGCAPIEASARQ
ncbi:fimbria/pilus outer membrane usher protein [Paraburkholderia oxyphila]|uniref:fimbria/pilus outer membrane usher protein n=1 Tax=Paraburkholderia oxyphila TaxID=614212 RepID=UPI000B32ED92|nr:fimbria/pilus outer membrane usher protein [Paraburkholderia oxyphila]